MPKLSQIFTKPRSTAKTLQNLKSAGFFPIVWSIFKIILLIYLVLLIILSLIDIRHFIGLTRNTYLGAKYLNRSVIHTQVKKFVSAKLEANLAQENFTLSLQEIKRINNSSLALLPIVSSQLLEIEHLMTATELMTRGLDQGLDFAMEIQKITNGNKSKDYSSFSTEQKAALLTKFYTSAPELNGLSAVFDLALNELNQLKLHGILWPAKYQILAVKDKIGLGSEILKESVPLSQILPTLAGYPATSTYLVVLQNSDELRPTGGFIGTYGILATHDGDIVRLNTHDIYHLDMPSQGHVKIIPPEPIKLYLNPDWYMRDANWSPDWPTSAKQLEWFYHLENQYLVGVNNINNFSGNWTGVIAINPRLVSNLLTLVGPITIDGQTYTSANFSQLLEFEVEQGYVESGTSKWQRKEVIGKILKELKIRLFNLPASQWADVLTVLKKTFESKDLMLYFDEPSINSIAQVNNWGGEVKSTKSDYLMLVDSNFASLKTDRVMSRDLNQKIERDANGLKATLNITYHNTGTAKDWRTDRYKNYLRLYVPEGSKLITFEGAEVPPATMIENHKTVFGSLIYVELNSSKTITISYYLPASIVQKWTSGQYSLYCQKQAGSRVNNAHVDVILPSEVESINPHAGVISSDRIKVSWSLDLTKDQEISLNF